MFLFEVEDERCGACCCRSLTGFLSSFSPNVSLSGAEMNLDSSGLGTADPRFIILFFCIVVALCAIVMPLVFLMYCGYF